MLRLKCSAVLMIKLYKNVSCLVKTLLLYLTLNPRMYIGYTLALLVSQVMHTI